MTVTMKQGGKYRLHNSGVMVHNDAADFEGDWLGEDGWWRKDDGTLLGFSEPYEHDAIEEIVDAPETGTLAELGVKPGDVVKCVDIMKGFTGLGEILTVDSDGDATNPSMMFCSRYDEKFGRKYRIVSRAPQPQPAANPLAELNKPEMAPVLAQIAEAMKQQPEACTLAEPPRAGVPGTTRADILDKAKLAVTQDRNATHGNPEDTFGLIAAYWSAHLNHSVKAADVAVMMGLLTIARIKSTPGHADDWIDLAGYAACGGEIATSERDE